MVVCDVARKRLRWDYSRWSYPIGKDSMYVAILRDVGDGNVQRTEFRHVRENHRIISKECTVLAKTHAKGKRLRCGTNIKVIVTIKISIFLNFLSDSLRICKIDIFEFSSILYPSIFRIYI